VSRTDAHTRYKFLPDGRKYEASYDRYLNGEISRQEWICLGWNDEWNSHFGRSNAQQWYAHQENRNERRNAKAALRRGDYDAIPLHMTGRHSAAWLAS
jgi:hypothetical protein